MNKISLWRKLHNGVTVDGKILAYSLQEAAAKVGVTKKSLDDYLLQLRFGQKYGFNFQLHKFDKVGVLRQFVTSEKKKDKDKEKVTTGKKTFTRSFKPK